MITIRKAEDRGGADHGWLQTAHTFSFSSYYDPEQMGFRTLRVINEDVVQPGGGFGEHGHRDMEIITIVLSGSLRHGDSLENSSLLGPGEVQRMTAGRGVRHSEVNASRTEPVHLYQIWILPEQAGLEPSYEQKAFPAVDHPNDWRLVVSPDGRDGSLRIHQDASIHLATLDAGTLLTRSFDPNRHAWLQVLKGRVDLNGRPLETSDGAAVSGEDVLTIRAENEAEVVLFDLA